MPQDLNINITLNKQTYVKKQTNKRTKKQTQNQTQPSIIMLLVLLLTCPQPLGGKDMGEFQDGEVRSLFRNMT